MANIIIPDGGTIGSTSDTDALTITNTGVVKASQSIATSTIKDATGTNNSISIATNGEATFAENIIIGTAGKGITFGGDPDSRISSATGSDGRTLYDYEEGTWTISTSHSSNSWSVANATYTKVGNIVTCGALISNITKNVTSAYLTMSLPFTSKSNQRAVGSIFHQNLNYSGTTPSLIVYVGGNKTNADIYRVQDNGLYDLQTHAITSSSTNFFFSITYRV